MVQMWGRRISFECCPMSAAVVVVPYKAKTALQVNPHQCAMIGCHQARWVMLLPVIGWWHSFPWDVKVAPYSRPGVCVCVWKPTSELHWYWIITQVYSKPCPGHSPYTQWSALHSCCPGCNVSTLSTCTQNRGAAKLRDWSVLPKYICDLSEPM